MRAIAQMRSLRAPCTAATAATAAAKQLLFRFADCVTWGRRAYSVAVRCRGVTGTVEQVAEAMQPHLGLAPGDGTSVNVAALLTSDAQCT